MHAGASCGEARLNVDHAAVMDEQAAFWETPGEVYVMLKLRKRAAALRRQPHMPCTRQKKQRAEKENQRICLNE